MRPNVGRSPVTWQRVHGEMMLPRVSVPIAKPTSPAAVVHAEPAEEPLDPCFEFQGLLVWPPNHWSPCASAPSVVLATSTAPASSSFWATVAFTSIVWLLNGAAPQVVL